MRPPRTPSRTKLRADEPVVLVHQRIFHGIPSCGSRTGRQVQEPFDFRLSSPSGLPARPGTARHSTMAAASRSQWADIASTAMPFGSARSSAVHRRPASASLASLRTSFSQAAASSSLASSQAVSGQRSAFAASGPDRSAPRGAPTWSFDQVGSRLRVREPARIGRADPAGRVGHGGGVCGH
jgi:hypothetical protein